MTGISSNHPVEDAAYRLVHGYRGGAQALAARVGMHPGTLNNKANPGQAGARLSIVEAVTLQLAANRFDILEAEAALCGFALVRLPDNVGVSDSELLNLYAMWHAEIGDVAECVMRTLGDGRVTPAELQGVKQEFHEQVAAGFEFLRRLEGLCDAA